MRRVAVRRRRRRRPVRRRAGQRLPTSTSPRTCATTRRWRRARRPAAARRTSSTPVTGPASGCGWTSAARPRCWRELGERGTRVETHISPLRTDPWDFLVGARRPRARRYVLKADTSRQWRLLDLQAIDTRLDQIAHRTATLPAAAPARRGRAARLTRARRRPRARPAPPQADVQREVAKADSDVQLVRDRAARNQTRLTPVRGPPRTCRPCSTRSTSLARRQAELEDIELEVMERAEALDAARGRARGGSGPSSWRRIDELTAARDAGARPSSTTEAADRAPGRALTSSPGSATTWSRSTRRSAPPAVASARPRCASAVASGCRLELNQVDISRIRAAADDEVLRCEECRRILVRTAESGL